AHAARPERLQRTLGALAAVDARRSEEDDGVLDLLILEAPQRLEVLREDPDRPGLGAVEELGVQIRHRLLRHKGNLPSECYDPPASKELPPNETVADRARARRPVDLRTRRTATAAGGNARAPRETTQAPRHQERDGDLRQRQTAVRSRRRRRAGRRDYVH